MNLIEHWGNGIPRIIDKVKAAGLREPEFIGGEVDLRINIYRCQVDTNNAIINANGTKNGANGVKCGVDDGTNGAEVPLNKEQTQIEKLLQIIEKNPSATQAYYAEKMGISKRTVLECSLLYRKKISIWMDEMGLISNPAMRKQVKNYRAYFNAKDRRLKVSTQNKVPETPAQFMKIECESK